MIFLPIYLFLFSTDFLADPHESVEETEPLEFLWSHLSLDVEVAVSGVVELLLGLAEPGLRRLGGLEEILLGFDLADLADQILYLRELFLRLASQGCGDIHVLVQSLLQLLVLNDELVDHFLVLAEDLEVLRIRLLVDDLRVLLVEVLVLGGLEVLDFLLVEIELAALGLSLGGGLPLRGWELSLRSRAALAETGSVEEVLELYLFALLENLEALLAGDGFNLEEFDLELLGFLDVGDDREGVPADDLLDLLLIDLEDVDELDDENAARVERDLLEFYLVLLRLQEVQRSLR